MGQQPISALHPSKPWKSPVSSHRHVWLLRMHDWLDTASSTTPGRVDDRSAFAYALLRSRRLSRLARTCSATSSASPKRLLYSFTSRSPCTSFSESHSLTRVGKCQAMTKGIFTAARGLIVTRTPSAALAGCGPSKGPALPGSSKRPSAAKSSQKRWKESHQPSPLGQESRWVNSAPRAAMAIVPPRGCPTGSSRFVMRIAWKPSPSRSSETVPFTISPWKRMPSVPTTFGRFSSSVASTGFVDGLRSL